MYDLKTAIDAINLKIKDFSFSISEVSCDDGITYFCFNNKVYLRGLLIDRLSI